MFDVPIKCRECGSTKLTWDAAVRNCGQIQNGLLNLNEIEGIFVLGCDECSETMDVVPSSEIATFLNNNYKNT